MKNMISRLQLSLLFSLVLGAPYLAYLSVAYRNSFFFRLPQTAPFYLLLLIPLGLYLFFWKIEVAISETGKEPV